MKHLTDGLRVLVGEAHCAGLCAGQGGVSLGAASSAGSGLSCTLWGLLGPWGGRRMELQWGSCRLPLWPEVLARPRLLR